MRKPPNLAGKPFKNQAIGKVWNLNLFAKPTKFGWKSFLKSSQTKSMKISNYNENLTIWLEILLKIKPNQKYQNLKLLRKPQHLAGNPFKNQAKRKV